MWYNFLNEWNGISLFLHDKVSRASDMHFYTDATQTGFGGYLDGRWFQGKFPPDLLCYNDKASGSMALYELYPIVVAAVLWGHLWTDREFWYIVALKCPLL